MLTERLVPGHDIIHLNVGGRKFSTSRNTLLWGGTSFFSVLLGGRIPSCKDEAGAYFIDRDPDLFAVILNYLRTRELNVSGIDPLTLRNEAQFYGLDSLVKKLSLCEEVFTGNCGDLLFHGYFPSPFLSTDDSQSEVNRPGPEQGDPLLPTANSVVNETCNDEPPVRRSATGDQSDESRTTKPTQETGLDAVRPTVPDSTANHDSPLLITPTAPVTLITCHQNLMAVVYRDCIGVFHLKDPTGWHLVWLSPHLPAPIDRLALTTKHTGAVGISTLLTPNSAAVGVGSSLYSNTASGQPVSTAQQNIVQSAQGSSAGSTSVASANNPPVTPSSPLPPAPTAQVPPPAPLASPQQPSPLPSHQSAPPMTTQNMSTLGCMVAAAVGSTISVWCLYPPPSSVNSAVASLGGVLGVSISPTTYGLSPLLAFSAATASGTTKNFNASLPRSKDPWTSELVGRFDLNKRAVDYLMFIGAKLVALSRRGLVGVRHLMTNTWQVWSTVPILSYSVAASELLLLGCANGRICSINIQKFPLRIGDNDLLVTEIYRDPLQDPITALSVHFTHKTASSSRNCMEIAYGTLSGRVCLIVQYPENVGYSPQLLQTFTVHRAMVTRVVLSEKHLISVCNDFNHVRTWAVTRFRGIISTQPGSTPIASFHITTLDVTNPQTLTDSVVHAAQLCATATRLSNPSRDIVRAHSQVVTTSATEQSRATAQTQSAFRFSQWRRRTSHSRSPGSTLDLTDPNSAPQPTGLPPSSPIPASIVYTQVDRSRPVYRSELGSPTDSGSLAPYQGAATTTDIVVLPRTSWLHEDPGNASARTSLVTNGNQGSSWQDPQPMERLQHSSGPHDQPAVATVGRCQTFHGSSAAPIATPDSNGSPSPLPVYRNARTDKNHSIPIIELHRYANDPGPYGEREDILVFVQKFTPNANQLFVRLGATGKRVCVIRSVDGTPISSFCVHEHDGSNRVGAHPRRYIFTGHSDGSVQVWDLTTALNSIKAQGPGLSSGTPLSGFDGYFSPELSTSGPISFGVASNPTVAITPGPFGVFTSHPTQAAHQPGGPTSHELVRLLESCQLGTSAASSLAGYSPGRLTPADSFTSVCLNGPATR